MEQDTPAVGSRQQPSGCRQGACIALIVLTVIMLVCLATLAGGGWMIVSRATQTAVAQTTGTAQSEATSESATVQFQATSDSATATTRAQEQATATSEAVATSTQEAYEIAAATSTAQAVQARAGLPDAHLEIYDPFDSSGNWDTTAINDEYASGGRYIRDGVYAWDVKAVQQQGVFIYDRLPRYNYKDFYLSVDIQKIKGPHDTGYGLVFRNLSDQYYAFEVVETQYLAFWSYYAEQWHALWYYYRIVARQGEPNTLTVHAEGNRFTLFLNGEKVRQIQDSRLESGSVGMFVSLPEADDEAMIEFDNFTLLVP